MNTWRDSIEHQHGLDTIIGYDVYVNGEVEWSIEGANKYGAATVMAVELKGVLWPRYACGCGGPEGQTMTAERLIRNTRPRSG